MSQVKIYGEREQLTRRRAAISDAIHSCLVEALQLPPDKRFQRFLALDAADFIFPPDRSPAYTIVEISMFEGRSVAARKELIRLLFERLETRCGIAPQDLEITIFETPRHNWGIRGRPGDELGLNYNVNV
jgi:phenylpyruvate tautomerase PptA (4-oxalocrotonate tautomerase family)